jgi:hypothetical protein
VNWFGWWISIRGHYVVIYGLIYNIIVIRKLMDAEEDSRVNFKINALFIHTRKIIHFLLRCP